MTATIDITRARTVTGWMSARELTWLATQALTARTIIEIGSFCGRSTRALADHCHGVVYTIDPWEGYTNDDGSQAKWILKQGPGSWIAIAEAFRRNLADHIKTGRVVPIQRCAADARELFEPASSDLLFIDGDHHYESVKRDIESYRDVVKPGGSLAGHDLNRSDWPGVTRAVVELVGPVSTCESIWWVTV